MSVEVRIGWIDRHDIVALARQSVSAGMTPRPDTRVNHPSVPVSPQWK